MKTYLKTFARMFKRHLTRLVSVFLMVLISVGFSAGIGMATDKMRYAFDDLYRRDNVSDMILRGAADLTDEAETLRGMGYEVARGGFMEFDGEAPVRLYTYPAGERDLQNKFESIEKISMPQDAPAGSLPIAVERGTNQLKSYDCGEQIELDLGGIPFRFIVTEIVKNPLHLAVRDDPSTFETEDGDGYKPLGSIFYFEGDLPFPNNNLYISVPTLKHHSDLDVASALFDTGYEQKLKTEKQKIEKALEDDLSGETPLALLTLHENFTFESYFSYTEKVETIGYVLMVVFLLVTLLVVLSTMTRLLEEERAQIACLSTLGYSPMKTLSKYFLFAVVGTVIGAAGGYFAAIGLAYIVYVNFNWNYAMPAFPAHISIAFFMIVAAIILVCTLAATLIAGLKMTRQLPSMLLRPKSPKPGKKVILERIPLLWNRISFKYKSTLRNVLRFKTRFFMTVTAVMASTALVLAGLAVLDCCIFQNIGTIAMIVVAVVVLVFAALLNAVVIYTLTNINISERNRELATLMVLGYHEREISLYVYREIYITSAVGILFGLPFGALLCMFVFSLMAFGSLATISWYVWLVAPLMSLFFTFLVTLMLRRKVVKIDMNASLKAVE